MIYLIAILLCACVIVLVSLGAMLDTLIGLVRSIQWRVQEEANNPSVYPSGTLKGARRPSNVVIGKCKCKPRAGYTTEIVNGKCIICGRRFNDDV